MSTVSSSSVELTACPTSPRAVSCPTERVSASVRASSSLNSRTFSMAIAAWSAKVMRSTSWTFGIGPGAAQPTTIAPSGRPSRIIGTPSMRRQPPLRANRLSYSGSAKTSVICTTAPVRMTLHESFESSGRIGYVLFITSIPTGETFSLATKCSISPSNRNTLAKRASQRRTALRAMQSNTGCTFDGELAMTLKISAVAVCRSSASLVSLNKRTFSIAITACSAKVFSNSICVSGKGRAAARKMLIAPTGCPSRSIGTDRTLR